MQPAKNLETKKWQSDKDTLIRKRFISVLLKAWMKLHPGGIGDSEMKGVISTVKMIELGIYFTSATQIEYLGKKALKESLRLLSEELKKSKMTRKKLPTIHE